MDEMRRHVVQRRIRCLSSLDPARIAAWPQVRSARRTDARIEIVTDAAEAVVRRLLGEDAALSELEVPRAGLAEAFLELTRDAAEAALANQPEAACLTCSPSQPTGHCIRRYPSHSCQPATRPHAFC